MITKIVSGGQTGADRAALDVAIKLNISHSGWVPKGRLSEDGDLPVEYQLQEKNTDNFNYQKKTEQSVIDSDGTVIISHGKLTGDSEFTQKMAEKQNKPWLHIDMERMSISYAVRLLQSWIIDNGIHEMNVAGSRANKDPEIYGVTVRVMEAVLGKARTGS